MEYTLTLTSGYTGDSILLRDETGRIVSAWSPISKWDIDTFVSEHGKVVDWPVQHPEGVQIDGRMATLADYGELVVTYSSSDGEVFDDAYIENDTLAHQRELYWDVTLA